MIERYDTIKGLFQLILFISVIYFITYLIKSIKLYFYRLFNPITENKVLTTYSLKDFMTPSELHFYDKIKELEINYNIIPQVNLASIVNKHSDDRYRNELFRNIDFAIFTKDYKKLLLLIELNDNTHNKYIRKDRDLKVKKILNDANIKLINFYSCYPNEKDYVINRIINTINQNQQ